MNSSIKNGIIHLCDLYKAKIEVQYNKREELKRLEGLRYTVAVMRLMNSLEEDIQVLSSQCQEVDELIVWAAEFQSKIESTKQLNEVA